MAITIGRTDEYLILCSMVMAFCFGFMYGVMVSEGEQKWLG